MRAAGIGRRAGDLRPYRFANLDPLDYVGWGRWVTWAFQVMPVFFLVGGYANARSWTAHHAQGEHWSWWIQRRARRLWWPTATFLVAGALAIPAARAAGVAPANIAMAGRLITLQLWFLPVYLVLITLTPLMHAAHLRWGLMVPVGMAAAAALASAGVPRLPLLPVCTARNGPNGRGSPRPRISARNRADSRLSRTRTMV